MVVNEAKGVAWRHAFVAWRHGLFTLSKWT